MALSFRMHFFSNSIPESYKKEAIRGWTSTSKPDFDSNTVGWSIPVHIQFSPIGSFKNNLVSLVYVASVGIFF